MVLHLFPVPAGTDAEHEAAVRDHIQRGNFLRQGDGIPLDHQADARAQTDAFGDRGAGAERHERIVGVPVHLRQVAAARKWCRAGSGDVGVLGKEEAVQAAFLHRSGQLHGLDAVVRGKYGDAEFRVV